MAIKTSKCSGGIVDARVYVNPKASRIDTTELCKVQILACISKYGGGTGRRSKGGVARLIISGYIM